MKIKILNVDDDDAGRYVKGRILRQAGFEVIDAETGSAALRLVETEKPVLVLLDIRLPDISGIEVCRRIKSKADTVATLVLQISATLLGSDDRVRGLECGADGYLTEPIMPAELVANVKAMVRLYEREKENRELLAQLQQEIVERKRAETERERLLAQEQRARETAEAANRSKDEFLAVVSHELRTPLNAMLGWVHILGTQKQPDPATFEKAVTVIRRNIELQRQLVEDLLDTARVISGKLRLEIKPVKLGTIIQGAVDTVGSSAEAKGVELYTQIDTEAENITGDPARLQQIVWNLLSNAIKFTPKGGRIELKLQRADTYSRITVSDTGRGIEPDFLPCVFDRFRQLDSSSTRRYGGLGLGLSLVRHLVELHGGQVSAESPGVGKGATFTVDLPLCAVALETRARPGQLADTGRPAELPSLTGLRVLVVDGREESRELLAAILSAHGAQVHAVGSGAEALAAVAKAPENRPAQVLVCDIDLPGEDGYTLIRKIRALEMERGVPLREKIPAVALTASAHAQPRDRLQVLLAGFQVQMAKPVDPEELIVLIGTLAEKTA
jgi:signal transduction histidine kinase